MFYNRHAPLPFLRWWPSGFPKFSWPADVRRTDLLLWDQFRACQPQDMIGASSYIFRDHSVAINQEGDRGREDPVCLRELPMGLDDNWEVDAELVGRLPVSIDWTPAYHDKPAPVIVTFLVYLD